MYYIYGISGPSLLIESTDSMIVTCISWARGMYGIYCSEARGGKVAARGLNAIIKMPCILRDHDITILYPVGIATIDTHL